MQFNKFYYLFLFFLLIIAKDLSAQYMGFANYPASTSTWGMGEEGLLSGMARTHLLSILPIWLFQIRSAYHYITSLFSFSKVTP